MDDNPTPGSLSGFTISGSSSALERSNSLLREANNILRQDEARKPLSPRRRPRKVRKSPAQPRRYKRPATVVPGSTSQAPELPSSPGPFKSPGAAGSSAEEAAAAILARPPSQVGHLNAGANSSEQAMVEQEGNDRLGIPEDNQAEQCPLVKQELTPSHRSGGRRKHCLFVE
ncbi:hypothetical protein MTO96_033106 [Rhipicephalus appendiculatus]